jgi:HlyD family secretion protein
VDSQAPGTLTTDTFDDLATFAERNRRADEQAELIAGMPALLERGVIYLIVAALVITLAILYLGKVHAVVETKGKILPEGNVVSLQSGQGGVVLEVYAHTGDHLAAGAPVVEVDASEAGLSLAQVRSKKALDEHQLQVLKSTLVRLDRVIADPRVLASDRQSTEAISSSTYQLLNGLETAGLQLDVATRDESLLPDRKQQSQQEYDLTKQRLTMLQRNRGDYAQAFQAEQQAQVRKKDQLLNVRKLADAKLLSVVELNAEEERVRAGDLSLMSMQERVDQMDIDISNAQLRLSELQTKLQTLENDSRATVRNARAQYDQAGANLRQERDNVQIQARTLESEIEHAGQQLTIGASRLELAIVRMPVAGTIAELKVRNAGEIVGAGSAIATVVPSGVPLMVEVNASDKDVAFVRPGIDARIKVEAFPFQQFGTARARVVKVLPAVGGNSTFIVQLHLMDEKLTANGEEFYLFPGLSVQADLITGSQRLLDVLLQGEKPGAKGGGQP